MEATQIGRGWFVSFVEDRLSAQVQPTSSTWDGVSWVGEWVGG